MDPSGSLPNADWIDVYAVPAEDICGSFNGFGESWSSCLQFGDSCVDARNEESICCKKRSRDDQIGQRSSKACREKLRRERLNGSFLELGALLEPGRPPRGDKAMILSNTVQKLVQLKEEAQQLKEANMKLQNTIKELKVEKNELRDEKTKLKAEKERLEQLIKSMSTPPVGFMPPMPTFQAAMAAQAQAASNKTAAVFPGFPGVAMWQWMPPAMVDTSHDDKLRPPVA